MFLASLFICPEVTRINPMDRGISHLQQLGNLARKFSEENVYLLDMILKRALYCTSFFSRITLDTGVQVLAILGGTGGECRAAC